MEEMRTFGYLCPKCGKPVCRSRSIFALEASNAEVECSCGNVIDFDQNVLEKGSIVCPKCGELLEFTTEDEEEDD